MKFMHKTSLLAVLAVALGVALPPQAFAQGKKFALVVGINKYVHESFPELYYAVNDATEMCDVLTKAGYTVTLITDKTGIDDKGKEIRERVPTKENIEREFDAIVKKCRAGKDDMVLIALAGHGMQIKGEPFFCPKEGVFSEDPKNDKKETLVSLREFYSKLQLSYAKSKLLLVDACRNEPGRAGIDTDKAGPPRGIGTIFSCSPGQRAFEKKELQHGVFFYFVLKALKGEVAEARTAEGVDILSLARYVAKAVPAKAKELGFPEQKPNLSLNLTDYPLLTAAAASAMLALDIEVDLGGGVKLPVKWMPLGGKVPETVKTPFYMGVYEVTQAQYQQVMGKNPSYFKLDGRGKKKVAGMDTKDFPVEMVSWEDAMDFCKKVSALPEAKANRWVIDLPTKDEWDYCCQAGTTSPFSFGPAITSKQVNFQENDDSPNRTVKVGSYKPNAFGLYDMHGNVWEWCKDDMGLRKGEKVQRGGSFRCEADKCSLQAEETGDLPVRPDYDYGFRVVLRVNP